MRLWRLQVLGLWGAALGLARVAYAEPTAPAAQPAPAEAAPQAGEAPVPEADLATARRHFENGIKLYRDQNYAGALAEFEAAYRIKPGAGSLQNVGLCYKALFRYAEAARTLETLLERHGSELSEEEKGKVRATITELESLVGTLRVKLTPAHARVTIDGRSAERGALSNLRLDVGEHTVVAEAPGYTSETVVVRIAGAHEQALDVALRPRSGFVSVLADDPQAAIAIDSKAVAFQRWSGPVSPGRHYVQVYKSGFATFERVINVELGKTEEIHATLGPPVEADEADAKAPLGQKAAEKPSLRGWYGLIAFSGIGLDDAPTGVNIEGARETAGASFGARAGYRIWTPVGVELLLEGGRHDVKGACSITDHESGCDAAVPQSVDFTLESFRVGGNLRLMSGGESVRFTSTVGVGAVRHKLEIDGGPTSKGSDPYFLVELGLQLNFGHLLAEADVVAYIDGTSGIRDSTNTQSFGDNAGLRMLGIGLRGGWSEWRPTPSPSRAEQAPNKQTSSSK